MTLHDIILDTWNNSTNIIMMRSFIDKVHAQFPRNIYDATILRQVRKLRELGEINYVVTNNRRSIYEKIT